jgi:transposase
MKNKAYKYRIYPIDEQKQLLAQAFGCVRVGMEQYP